MAKPKVRQNVDPRKRFVPRWLPLIIAGAALVVYLLTLNHWLSLLNMAAVADIAGWTWNPDYYIPLLIVLTYPLRWLPKANLPLILNVSAAVCGTLTLGLLARCVAILPHDRTEAERTAEKSDFSFLTNRFDWVPPILAAAMCGLQSGFWQNATNFTGETMQMLVFAFIIWEILEFRLDEKDSRLYWATLAFGAGTADSWAFAGYFPCFVLALVWSKGVGFFHPFFIIRSLFCLFAGASLFLLLPTVNVFNHADLHISFWDFAKPNLKTTWTIIKGVTNPDIRYMLGILSLSSVLPVFLLSIRWPESFGDASYLGKAISNLSFHLVNTLVLGVCLWVMFDPPFSPQALLHNTSLGTNSPGLTFYFLTALSIGYYAGYLLAVFGKWGGRQGSRYKGPSNPFEKAAVQKISVGVIILVGIIAIMTLVYKNLPEVRAMNSGLLHTYAQSVLRCLPAKGGILLGDPDKEARNEPWRLYAVQAELIRSGRIKDYVPVDTHSLIWPDYQRFLNKSYPNLWPLLISDQNSNCLSPIQMTWIVNTIAKTNDIFYLNPSFGYYFEHFYLEPHGLVYQLKPRPAITFLPPPATTNLLAENKKFWNSCYAKDFGLLQQSLKDPAFSPKINLAERLLVRLHTSSFPDQNADLARQAYSQAINFWGVQLQRCNQLAEAADYFNNAITLNPENIVAQINLDFNSKLRSGAKIPDEFSLITSDQLGRYRSWTEILNADGPFDDPNYCLNTGTEFVGGALPRQAVASLSRARDLVPDDPLPRLWLAKIYLAAHLPDQALEALRDTLNDPARFGINKDNSTSCNILAAQAYMNLGDFQHGIELIQTELDRHPDNSDLSQMAARTYFTHGLFAKALPLIERWQQEYPNDPDLTYNRGYALFKLKQYPQAAAAFTQVLTLQTNNNKALFDRGYARLYSKQYDLAKADFQTLQQIYTNEYPVAYGLAQVSEQRHDTNEVIRNYQIYLAHAPTNTAEYKSVRERLGQWRGH